MAHVVASLFHTVGLTPSGVVPWGTPPPCRQNGVYVVALTADPNKLAGTISLLPASHDALTNWMHERRGLTVDETPASVDALCARLGRYWLPDEVVVYIGKTEKKDGLFGRLKQFYRHTLGRTSPHRGGQWIKALSVMPRLYVHYAPCADPVASESAMIGDFCGNDPTGPFPFANLEWRENGRLHRRKHDIR